MRALIMIVTVIGGLLPGAARGEAAPPEPIAVTATPIALDSHDPESTRVGRLRFRGGLALRSADVRFGGLSGLRVSADGERFLAVSDRGHLLRGRLLYDERGDLARVEDVTIAPLVDAAAAALLGARGNDAEALEVLPNGDLLVAFEGRHRIMRYPADGGAARAVTAPRALRAAPGNGGLETLVALGDGRLLAITEEQPAEGGVRGWLKERDGDWRPLTYATAEGFRPTDAALLPSGDVIVVERLFPPPAIRVRLLPQRDIVAGATLRGERIAQFLGSLNYDNMEAIAARRDVHGETLVYLVSDDNYSPLQRTLLLMFALSPA